MNTNLNPAQVKEQLEAVLQRHFGCTAKEASKEQMYKAAAITVKSMLSDKRAEYKRKVNKAGAKRVYYMCMEFLLGRSLKTNLRRFSKASRRQIRRLFPQPTRSRTSRNKSSVP